MGLGILGTFAAGAAGGAGDIAQGWVKNEQTLDLQKQLADIEQQKAIAIETAKHDLSMKWQQEGVERVNKAQEGIISRNLSSKYGASDAAVADADAGNTDRRLTDEQKSVIAQSKAKDAAKMRDDVDTRVRAGIETGDLGLKDAAAYGAKEDKIASMQQSLQEKVQFWRDKLTQDSADRNAKMQLEQTLALTKALHSLGGGKDGKLPSDAAMIEYMVDHKMIENTPDARNQAYALIKTSKTPGESVTDSTETDSKGRIISRKVTRKGPGDGDPQGQPSQSSKDRPPLSSFAGK